jgi:hypothetical protein
LQCLFFRVDFRFGFDTGGRKKLLRFSTSLSAGPVVAPIKFRHFWIPVFNTKFQFSKLGAGNLKGTSSDTLAPVNFCGRSGEVSGL